MGSELSVCAWTPFFTKASYKQTYLLLITDSCKNKEVIMKTKYVHTEEMYDHFHYALKSDLQSQVDEYDLALLWYKGLHNGFAALVKDPEGEKCAYITVGDIWTNWPRRIEVIGMAKQDYKMMEVTHLCKWEDVGETAARYIKEQPQPGKRMYISLTEHFSDILKHIFVSHSKAENR